MTRTTSPDPIARIRRELVAAAARANRRHVRLRRLSVLAAVPLVLLAVATGAVAFGGFSTGVPAIDSLLATEGGADDPTDPRPGGDASDPLPLPNADDGEGAAATAFVSQDGRICRVEGDFRASDGAPRGTSGGGDCYEPDDLARTLSKRKVICCSSSHGADRRVYHGYAAGDVTALRFLMEDGHTIDARLAPKWTPDVPGGGPLRIFTVVDERDIDVGSDGVQVQELRLLTPTYQMEADLDSGRTVEVPIR